MIRAFSTSALLVVALMTAACSSQAIAPTPAPTPIPTTVPTIVPTIAATIAPTSVPVAAPTPSVVATKELFRDDFSTPSKSWFTGKVDNGSIYEYVNGGYRIYVGADDATQSVYLSGKTTNVSIEVDVKRLGGPDDGRFGIVCRGDGATGATGYAFAIGANNLYGIYKTVKSTPLALAEYYLQPSSIATGNAVNHLRADCIGNTLALYVNGQKLVEVQDSAFATGSIGLMASTGESTQKGVDAFFDNYVAREALATIVSPTPSATVPAFGKLLFQDKFDDPASGWLIQANPELNSGYNSAGYYQIKVNKADQRFVITPKKNFADVSIQADFSKRAGPELSTFGLACRVQDDKNYYAFMVGSDGYFGIRKIKAGNAIDLSVHDGLASPIKQGDKADNRVRAECLGDRLALYVNGQKLDEVRDGEFKSGDVGFHFASPEKTGLEIFFANFEVRGP
jgi:hypothetical protein